jgi:O-antigen/teichoic acid export membrane protein
VVIVADLEGGASKRGFWSHSAILTAGMVAASAVSVAYVALSVRTLGPERYSAVAASLSLAYLLSLLFGPLETGVGKLAAEYHGLGDRSRLATLAFGTLRRLALPLLISVVVWLLVSPLLRAGLRLDSWGVLLAVTGYSAFSLLACVPRGVQRGDHRFFAYGVNQLAESVLRIATGLAAIAAGMGAAGAMAGYAAGMAGAFGLALWQLRDLRGQARVPIAMREVQDFSLPLFLIYFFTLFTVNLDVLVAKRTLGEHQAGIYGACSALTRLVFVLTTPVTQVLLSRVAALRVRGLPTRRIAAQVCGLLAAVLALAGLVPWLAGAEVLALAYGADFQAGAHVLRIQWVTTALLIIDGTALFVLLGEGRTAGTWALLGPCALLAGLMWRFHDSGVALAVNSLVAAAAGLLVIAVLVVRSRS